MPYLQSPGGQVILQSSSTGAGEWYRVHPKLGNLSFQWTHLGTSVGASVSSTLVVEASNDGVNALGTPLGTVVFGGGQSPASDGFTTAMHYEYVRAKINSVGASTAGSAGTSMTITCTVSAQMRS